MAAILDGTVDSLPKINKSLKCKLTKLIEIVKITSSILYIGVAPPDPSAHLVVKFEN